MDDTQELQYAWENLSTTEQYHVQRAGELEACLKRIVSLTNEWDSNKLGNIQLQRKRWQMLGKIARDALLDIGNR